jgi:hypothetical protein
MWNGDQPEINGSCELQDFAMVDSVSIKIFDSASDR